MDSPSPGGLTLLDAVRREIGGRHLSIRTEQQFVYWIRGFVRHFGRRHPRQTGAPEVHAFVSMLANERRVSASTHNQDLSALLFLYRAVLKQELPWLDQLARLRRPQRVRALLAFDKVRAVFDRMDCEHALLARLLYGTGRRIREALRLRVRSSTADRASCASALRSRANAQRRLRTTALPPGLSHWRRMLACGRRLAVCASGNRQTPAPIARIRTRLGHRIIAAGGTPP